MFERYTEAARHAVFYARYEASRLGSPFIETQHLLLALLRDKESLVRRLLPVGAEETILREIEEATPPRSRVSTSADLPLSDETKRVLAYGAEDATAMGHMHIGAEHLLLGVVREHTCVAARILQRYGIGRERVWSEVAQGGTAADSATSQEPPARDSLHALVNTLPDGALQHAKRMLEHLHVWPPSAPLRERMSKGFRPGAVTASGAFGGWTSGPGGEVEDGDFSSTRVEDGAVVVETHRIHRGHEITLIERLRLSEDGKTLAYSQEIHGPKKEFRHEIEFDVS
jgi:Clp amino terminal domain, pathogenicity island component